MRLGYFSIIMATGLAYASMVYAVPIGVSLRFSPNPFGINSNPLTSYPHKKKKVEPDVLPRDPGDKIAKATKPPPVGENQVVKPKVAVAGKSEHQTSLASSSGRSIIHITYPSVDQARAMFPGSQAYTCIAQEQAHKTLIMNFFNERGAKAALSLQGDPPQYVFRNPTQCICFENNRPDVVFMFNVGSVGGGPCKSDTNSALCQGQVKAATSGRILGPPNGRVVYTIG